MTTRKYYGSSSPYLPPDMDFIDLTEESPTRRSLQTRSRSATHRIPHSLRTEEENAMLVSTVLDALGSTMAVAASRTSSRSGTRNRTRSNIRVRTIGVLSKSRNDSNNQCRNEVTPDEIINLDDTVSPEYAGPWCINNSTTVTPAAYICAVCLEDLMSRKPTATRCGHVYCEECLTQVICTTKKCPKCTTSITQKSCRRLYF